MPARQTKKRTKKQSAKSGLFLSGPKSQRGSNKRKTTFIGLPIRVVQPLLFGFIVIASVTATILQYHLTHEPAISKIPAPSGYRQQAAHTKVLAKSLPVHLKIPLAYVDTSVVQLGQNSDGTIETPTGYDIVGWYKYGPTPGELGPSVIVGHVDNYKGLAVFWYLKDLKPNDQIEVDRADGSVANFAVTKVEDVPQDNFPTKEVYGPINYAGIRLITCGGVFNHETGRYDHNIVVFGKLI